MSARFESLLDELEVFLFVGVFDKFVESPDLLEPGRGLSETVDEEDIEELLCFLSNHIFIIIYFMSFVCYLVLAELVNSLDPALLQPPTECLDEDLNNNV